MKFGWAIVAGWVLVIGWNPDARAAGLDPVVRLTSPDEAASMEFGWGVAVTGHGVAVLTTSIQFPIFGGQYSPVYFFEETSPGKWEEVAKIPPGMSDVFGSTFGDIGADGDRLVLGLPSMSTSAAITGGALVYDRQASSQWTQTTTLAASDAEQFDALGKNVAISGGTVLTGAPNEDGASDDFGAAYLFRQSGGGWSQLAKLTASDAAVNRHFGTSVALEGGVAAIGSVEESSERGSVYLFEEGTSGWAETARLSAPDSHLFDEFGSAVGVEGTTVAVAGGGKLYVYERSSGGEWDLATSLSAPAGGSGDFGRSLAIDEGTIAVGAWSAMGVASNTGAVHLYRRDAAGEWEFWTTVLAPDGVSGDRFGWDVALRENRLVVGAYRKNVFGRFTGAAYVYDLPPVPEPTTWVMAASGLALGWLAWRATILGDARMPPSSNPRRCC